MRAYIKQARAWDRFHFECGIASIVQHDSSVLFIIGIPFGTQHVKGAALTLPSVGTTKVRKERTEAARADADVRVSAAASRSDKHVYPLRARQSHPGDGGLLLQSTGAKRRCPHAPSRPAFREWNQRARERKTATAQSEFDMQSPCPSRRSNKFGIASTVRSVEFAIIISLPAIDESLLGGHPSRLEARRFSFAAVQKSRFASHTHRYVPAS